MSEFPVTTWDANGWPLLTPDDYLRALPAYTTALAARLGAFGDTGLRNVTSLLINGWTADRLVLSRTGNRVTLFGLRLKRGTNATFLVLPAGFKPASGGSLLPVASSVGDTDTGVIAVVHEVSAFGNTLEFGASAYFEISWLTRDTWPAHLPGTATT